MMATACEPRHPPWLQRALAKKTHSERVWGLAASDRLLTTGDRDQALAKAATPADGEEPLSVWEAVARDHVAYAREYLGADKHRVFVRHERTRSGGAGESLLHVAASHGAVEVARFLAAFLETAFSRETQRQAVNAVDTQYGRTSPLVAACRSSGGAALGRLEITKLLVRCGADTAAVDAHGDNALHWCARNAATVLLRYLLKETDAGADAVFARNNKRETPLEIAQRRLARTQQDSSALVAYKLLRDADRECNLRLKMQLISRGQVLLSAQAMTRDSEQLKRCLEAADSLVQRSSSALVEALAQAEKKRQRAEEGDATTASERARAQALEWLEGKEGKAYLKKQVPAATAEVKQQIQSGAMAKPKDMEKAVVQYTTELYVRMQAQSARQGAVGMFRAKRPPYPIEITGTISTAALAKALHVE